MFKVFKFNILFYFECKILGRTRLQNLERHLNEAYACVDCSVPVQMLDGEAIARIRRGLLRPQRTRPKQNKVESKQLSPRTQRRQNDNVFTPPVPYALQTVDVQIMDADCE